MAKQRSHTYSIRPAVGGPPVLTTTVDHEARTLTMTTADGTSFTADVTLARAIWMTIQAAVYDERSLQADGPTLTLQYERGAPRKAPW
ncbi:MAG: hypothetical protein ACRDTU_10750 [Micromonosporaceae bacterium]